MRRALRKERLRAAYEASGLGSLENVARAAGVTHPTLSRIFSGKVKALNAATLSGLADALRVPAEWLTGERQDLPYISEWGPLAERSGPSRWERPTADDVRWSWLMQRVEQALRRDLREWYEENADEAYDAWGQNLLVVFTRLGSSMVWRSVFLEPSPRPYEPWECDEQPTDTWLTHVLEPWFAGKAYLNAEVLRAVLQALLTSVSVQFLGSDVRDADALRGLERYEAAAKEFFPDAARYDRSLMPTRRERRATGQGRTRRHRKR